MTVDVIIPVYNGREHLRRAVNSVLDCPHARVILVDDGSTDGTAEQCDALAADARVTVIHRENGGASAARNTGLDAATADYVTFLDADDMLLPGALTLLVSHLKAGLDDVDAIQGRVVRQDAVQCGAPAISAATADKALALALADPTRHLHCHGWAFRRAVLTERFNENLTLGEDGEWLMRTLRGIEYAAYLDAPVYRYTVRADSAVHCGENVPARYLATLEAAAPVLDALNLPEEAALYRLTHLLLILTHGVFRKRGLVRSWKEAGRLCRQAPFARAFDEAQLTGLSPRICTLRLLRAGCIPLAWAAIRIRQLCNDRAAARTKKHG